MALTKISTDGVKDDAITKVKIPANQIEASELADNAVDTNAIADNAVTAGKLASGVQTTINNNADNRVITGSGTANTLEGEAGFTFVAGSDPNLTLSGSGHPRINLTSTSGADHTGVNFGDSDDVNAGMIQYTNSSNDMQFHTNGSEKMRILSGGGLTFNGDTGAGNALDDYEEGTFSCTLTGSSSNPSYGTSSNGGFYVRIGKFVSLYYLMIINSVSSQGSGNWQIEGIPFSHDNNVNAYRSNGIIGYNDIFDFEVNKLYVNNSDKLLIIPNGVTQSNQTYAQNPLSTGYFSFSITYRTDS